MTQQYDNSNSGALFKNQKKQEGDKRPEYTGSINSKCPKCGHPTDWWISAWLKLSRAGERFMSLAVQQKDGLPREAPRKIVPQVPIEDEMNDETPYLGGPKAPF